MLSEACMLPIQIWATCFSDLPILPVFPGPFHCSFHDGGPSAWPILSGPPALPLPPSLLGSSWPGRHHSHQEAHALAICSPLPPEA